jgi:hypothetical protein
MDIKTISATLVLLVDENSNTPTLVTTAFITLQITKTY